MIFIAKQYWGYVLATNLVRQNILRYICAWWKMFACYTRPNFEQNPKICKNTQFIDIKCLQFHNKNVSMLSNIFLFL